jgi:hypothetical protein
MAVRYMDDGRDTGRDDGSANSRDVSEAIVVLGMKCDEGEVGTTERADRESMGVCAAPWSRCTMIGSARMPEDADCKCSELCMRDVGALEICAWA